MYEYILDGKIIVPSIFTSQILFMVFPQNPGEEYFSASL